MKRSRREKVAKAGRFLGVVKYRVPYTANRDWGIFWCDHFILFTANWSSFCEESADATPKCVWIGSAPVWQMRKPASWVTASAHLATASAAPLARYTMFQQILFIHWYVSPFKSMVIFWKHRWRLCVSHILSLVLKRINGLLEILGSLGHHIYL